MANHCSNYVRFSGGSAELENVKALFQQVIEAGASQYGTFGYTFRDGSVEHFLDLKIWSSDGHFHIDYYTNWEPNAWQILLIANYCEVSSIHDAFEFGCGVYQRCIHEYGESIHFPRMQQNEFAVYDFDRDMVPYHPDDYQSGS